MAAAPAQPTRYYERKTIFGVKTEEERERSVIRKSTIQSNN